jgi:hypothetical protein
MLWDRARIWNVPDPHVEQITGGLRKAGLVIEPDVSQGTDRSRMPSGREPVGRRALQWP